MDNNEKKIDLAEEDESIEKPKNKTNRGRTQAQVDNLAKGRLTRQANILKRRDEKIIDAKKAIIEDDPDYKDLKQFKEDKAKPKVKPVEADPEIIFVKKPRRKVVIVQESDEEEEEIIKPKQRVMKSQQNKKSIIKIQEAPTPSGEQCYFE
jgi:hypothetical protein